MNHPFRSTALTLSLLTLVGCTSTRQILRSDISLRGDPKQTQDGLTIEAAVTDLQTMQSDARLARTIDAVKNVPGVGPMTVKVRWVLLNPPTFQLRVANNTGHVIHMNGAIFKLIDQAGNLYDAMTKDKLAAQQSDAFATLESQGVAVTGEGKAELNSALRSLKLLDNNTELLPDMTETFFLSFDLGVPPTADAVNQWLAQQTALRLKIYEVPTQTDPAGNVTRRVAFEFPVDVKTFRETWEDSMSGSKLVSSEAVTK